MNRNDVFWTHREDEEVLTSNTKDSAIDDYLSENEFEEDEIPNAVLLYKHEREKVSLTEVGLNAEFVLDNVIERLDERYGNFDGDPSIHTEELKEAANVFLSKVKEHFIPWTCQVTGKETVKIDRG